MTVKCRDLTWLCKSPKFNFHLLQRFSKGFKMVVLTPILGFIINYNGKNASETFAERYQFRDYLI